MYLKYISFFCGLSQKYIDTKQLKLPASGSKLSHERLRIRELEFIRRGIKYLSLRIQVPEA